MLLDIGTALVARSIRNRANDERTGPVEGAMIATGAALLPDRRSRKLGMALLVVGGAIMLLRGSARRTRKGD